MTKNLYIIVGPSYSGKTTLSNALQCHGYRRAITCTTREKRDENDIYNFVNVEEFQGMVERGELLEHAEYCGNFYGVSSAALAAADYCILEPNGVRYVKEASQGGVVRSVRVIGIVPDFATVKFRFDSDPSHGINRLQEDRSRFLHVEDLCDVAIVPRTEEQTLNRVLNYIAREENIVSKEGR